MTDGSSNSSDEGLELRARPRPIRRLNKQILMIGSGGVALLIAIATLIALKPSPPADAHPELFNTERKQIAEGLEKLPKSYAEMIPKLGPPAPGDIGRAAVEAEKKTLVPSSEQSEGVPFTPNPEEEAARAERIRQARMATQARESGLFIRLSEKRKSAGSELAGSAPPSLALRTPGKDEREALAATGPIARPMIAERGGDMLPSSQARKLGFVGAGAETETTNPHALASQRSPYTLMAGSVISASLVTGINSDLPGVTIAQVTEDVYDTVSGEHLLIPQGSRLIGKYDSVVVFGQKRALLIWNRVMLPNGDSMVIEPLPAADGAGYAGLEDEVDFHTRQLLQAVGMATVLEVGTQLTLGQNETDLVKLLRQSVQKSSNEAGQRLVERQLDVQPTITIKPGWPLRVIVAKDLQLKPYRAPPAARAKY
jgi:type IV secretion system protein TrbI